MKRHRVVVGTPLSGREGGERRRKHLHCSGREPYFKWEQCGFVFERRRLSRQQEEWPLSSAFDAYDAFDFLTPTLIGR